MYFILDVLEWDSNGLLKTDDDNAQGTQYSGLGEKYKKWGCRLCSRKSFRYGY